MSVAVVPLQFVSCPTCGQYEIDSISRPSGPWRLDDLPDGRTVAVKVPTREDIGSVAHLDGRICRVEQVGALLEQVSREPVVGRSVLNADGRHGVVHLRGNEGGQPGGKPLAAVMYDGQAAAEWTEIGKLQPYEAPRSWQKHSDGSYSLGDSWLVRDRAGQWTLTHRGNSVPLARGTFNEAERMMRQIDEVEGLSRSLQVGEGAILGEHDLEALRREIRTAMGALPIVESDERHGATITVEVDRVPENPDRLTLGDVLALASPHGEAIVGAMLEWWVHAEIRRRLLEAPELDQDKAEAIAAEVVAEVEARSPLTLTVRVKVTV